MIIDHELAKRLKDAGFPYSPILENKEGCLDFIVDAQSAIGYRVPTLSELIEACGPTIDIPTKVSNSDYEKKYKSATLFFHLRPYFDGPRKLKWSASFSNEGLPEISCPKEVGSTAEEAVANLWLSLKKV